MAPLNVHEHDGIQVGDGVICLVDVQESNGHEGAGAVGQHHHAATVVPVTGCVRCMGLGPGCRRPLAPATLKPVMLTLVPGGAVHD